MTVEKDSSTPVPGPVTSQYGHLPGDLLLPSHRPSHRPPLGLRLVALPLQPPDRLPSPAALVHTGPPPPAHPVGGGLHWNMTALVLDVCHHRHQEPDRLHPPAPLRALLLAGDAVLEGDGGHVARPQPGAAPGGGDDGGEEEEGGETEHISGHTVVTGGRCDRYWVCGLCKASVTLRVRIMSSLLATLNTQHQPATKKAVEKVLSTH